MREMSLTQQQIAQLLPRHRIKTPFIRHNQVLNVQKGDFYCLYNKSNMHKSQRTGRTRTSSKRLCVCVCVCLLKQLGGWKKNGEKVWTISLLFTVTSTHTQRTHQPVGNRVLLRGSFTTPRLLPSPSGLPPPPRIIFLPRSILVVSRGGKTGRKIGPVGCFFCHAAPPPVFATFFAPLPRQLRIRKCKICQTNNLEWWWNLLGPV